MNLYFDSSILVSLAVTDDLSDRAWTFVWANREPISLSDFGLLEVYSAISRLVRTKSLPLADARTAVSDFRNWAAQTLTERKLEPADLAFAGATITRFDLSLKAPDAIHLAVAHRLGATLTTFDRQQAASARTLGVSTMEP